MASTLSNISLSFFASYPSQNKPNPSKPRPALSTTVSQTPMYMPVTAAEETAPALQCLLVLPLPVCVPPRCPPARVSNTRLLPCCPIVLQQCGYGYTLSLRCIYSNESLLLRKKGEHAARPASQRPVTGAATACLRWQCTGANGAKMQMHTKEGAGGGKKERKRRPSAAPSREEVEASRESAGKSGCEGRGPARSPLLQLLARGQPRPRLPAALRARPTAAAGARPWSRATASAPPPACPPPPAAAASWWASAGW